MKIKHDEDNEQKALFIWAGHMRGKYPELRWLYAIPNGGKRNLKEGVRLKAQGVKAGVSDIHLPVARGGYHSLYIELKAPSAKDKRGSEAQRKWIEDMNSIGNKAVIAVGWQQAASVIEQYLKGDVTNEKI